MKLMGEMREERREEVMEMRKEMIGIKQEKLELEKKVRELTTQLEVHERKVAEVELKSTRNLPYVMVCAFKDYWTAPNSTITYDRLSADYTRPRWR